VRWQFCSAAHVLRDVKDHFLDVVIPNVDVLSSVAPEHEPVPRVIEGQLAQFVDKSGDPRLGSVES
jgi:hypothetical protein